MSLHDVSKNSPNRIKPELNANDKVVDRQAHGTTQLQHTIDESESDGLLVRERQILAVQDGVNKAAFGFYGDSNRFGLKVAEDGKDVLTAANDELVFNSEQNTFKIVDEGTISVPGFNTNLFTTNTYAGSANSSSYLHGLEYTPAIIAYMDSGDGSFRIPCPHTSTGAGGTGGGIYVDVWNIYVSDTEVYVVASAISYGPGITSRPIPARTVKFYLLQETAN